jgi:hypothetical protein
MPKKDEFSSYRRRKSLKPRATLSSNKNTKRTRDYEKSLTGVRSAMLKIERNRRVCLSRKKKAMMNNSKWQTYSMEEQDARLKALRDSVKAEYEAKELEAVAYWENHMSMDASQGDDATHEIGIVQDEGEDEIVFDEDEHANDEWEDLDSLMSQEEDNTDDESSKSQDEQSSKLDTFEGSEAEEEEIEPTDDKFFDDLHAREAARMEVADIACRLFGWDLGASVQQFDRIGSLEEEPIRRDHKKKG